MVFGKYINKYYLKYSLWILIGIIALAAVDYYQLFIPEIYGKVVDGMDPLVSNVHLVASAKDIPAVVGTNDVYYSLSNLCVQMLGIVAIMVVGRFLWRIGLFGSAIKMETDLRNEMFDHCKNLSQQYYQVNKVGNMMSLFTNDLETIQECFGDGVLMLGDAVMLGGLAIYKMMRLNVTLSILALIPLCILSATSFLIGRYMMKKWKIRQEAFSELSDFAQESFSGLAVVKAFVKEGLELLAFRKINKNNENANVEFTRASTLLMIFIHLFVQSVICIILGVGGYYAYTGVFSAAQLIMFLSYFNATVWPIMAISRLIEMSSRGKASMSRINELLDAKIDVKDNDNVRTDITSIAGTIEFKDLTFRFPLGEYDALENISFKINAGENIGIIGKTGAGKTTIVDLILRTYNVPDGTIFVDGYDVNTLPIKLIRENAAYVPQDNFLFSETIAENIAFAYGGEATHEDIVRVSMLADLHNNIQDQKDKYDTMLGERGVTISGGQKQRLSIARALLKEAPILILDDSVSAVDTKTEKNILENLKETRQGKTTILIAHRITTIEHMDRVLFIDEGKVVAFDSHDNLVANCPEYKKMVDLQRLEDEVGGNS